MSEDPSPAPSDNKRSRRKVLAWVARVLGAAATAVIVPILAQNANSLIAHVTTTGDPIAIHAELQPALDDVSLPVGQELSESDLATLSTMKPQDETAWLAAHKHGVITSTRTLALTLTGNRPEPVRITGIHVDSTCGSPERGTMVRMVVVDIQPSVNGADDQANVRVCDVQLSLRLLQQGRDSTEKVPATVRVMGVEPFRADDAYDHVFVGTGICKTVVAAPPRWMRGPGQPADLGCGGTDNVAYR